MWLSIRFTLLPIEALEIKNSTSAQIVIESNQVICVNKKAALQGIKHNQSLSTAYALCNEIEVYERNIGQEKQYLCHMALLIYAYTPSVAIEKNGLLLAEIGNSIKLYNNLESLLTLIAKDLDQEAISYQLGLGDNPKIAELFSYYTLNLSLSSWIKQTSTFDKKELHSKLSTIPVDRLDIPTRIIHQLLSVGIKNLAELASLPQQSIRKRFGKNLSEYLLKLSGHLADPKIYFVPKEVFYEKLDFLNVVHHRQGLFSSIKKLLKNLCQFLSVKQKHTQNLYWQLYDIEKNSIGFNVLISDSQISMKTYFELTQLNLERYTLHAPIEAISLTADRLSELIGETNGLFEQVGDFKQEINFINKIRAKLGSDSCYSLQQKAEHLPELSSRQRVDHPHVRTGDDRSNGEFECESLFFESTTNPSWLFKEPKLVLFNNERLIWNGELRIISHKERIISQWWKQETVRDYFLAEHDSGVIYWVFFERVNMQWFIHGIYS